MSLTTKDGHVILNLIVNQMTGQTTLSTVNTSNFVATAEKVMASGMENVLNAMSIVAGRLYIDAMQYDGKFKIIRELDGDVYTTLVRHVSYYAKPSQETGASNTDLFTNLAQGYTNGRNEDVSTASMWEQNQAMPLEMWFGNDVEWQDSLTFYEYQVKKAFTNEEEWTKFWNGALTERKNDITSQIEAWDRMAFLNQLAMTFDMGEAEQKVNMTKLFNDTYGTSYTSAQLRTTYLADFTKFFVATVKTLSDDLENRSKHYHWSVPKTVGDVTYNILRHTPKSMQRMVMYSPFYNLVEASVMPEIFNTNYLDLSQFETVTYWQVQNSPAIRVTPAVTNKTSGVTEAGANVSLDYVLGAIFDERAVKTNHRLTDASTTPKEARKHYRNMWWTFNKSAHCDPTHNFILFYMSDPAPSGQ